MKKQNKEALLQLGKNQIYHYSKNLEYILDKINVNSTPDEIKEIITATDDLISKFNGEYQKFKRLALNLQ